MGDHFAPASGPGGFASNETDGCSTHPGGSNGPRRDDNLVF
jgi:hypothetical protein